MADAPLEKTLLTLDEVLKLPDQVEIIDGEMRAMAAAGIAHHLIAGNVYNVVNAFAEEYQIGTVFFADLTYLMFSEAGGLKDSFPPGGGQHVHL